MSSLTARPRSRIARGDARRLLVEEGLPAGDHDARDERLAPVEELEELAHRREARLGARALRGPRPRTRSALWQ